MSNREIEQKILNYDLEIYELEEYLDENFVSVMTGMVDALYVLMKHANKNRELIDDIFKEIEGVVTEEKEEVKLKLIVELIKKLNNRIEATYNKKSKNDIIGLKNRLIKILREIENKKVDEINNNIMHIFMKLIYEEKSIENIEALIKSKKNIEYKIIDEIFSSVLEDYVSATEEENINYFYKVIVIFVKSCFNKDLSKNSEKYMKILNSGSKREHVKLLIDRLNNKKILQEDLKKKYDVSTNNHLCYKDSEYNLCDYARHDYTYQKVITIDDEGNECNDDGLFIEKNNDGSYTLYIHISDIPTLIKKDSYLDIMAYKSAETIYLCDNEITVYPENISNNLGSLLEGNVRNVITYRFIVNPNFEIDPDCFKIERSIIKVGKSLSYNEVDRRLKKVGNNYTDTMLVALNCISSILKSGNLYKDIYRKTENKTTGEVTNSSLANKSNAAKIVQEMMILTNSYVDKYFVQRGYPYIHRIHNAPSSDIDKNIMLILGIDSDTLRNNPKCVKILNAVKERYLNAEYSSTSAKHYGLGLDYYSHSTSPLRRYADALGQYVMYDILFNENFDDKTIYKWEHILKEACPYLNERIKNNALFASDYNYLVAKKKIRKK